MRRDCYRGHGLYTGRRCPACERERLTARGTPTQRGYDSAHQRARRVLKAELPAPCYYCGGWVDGSQPWVAAHLVDGDPVSPRVHAHPVCNERAKVARTA